MASRWSASAQSTGVMSPQREGSPCTGKALRVKDGQPAERFSQCLGLSGKLRSDCQASDCQNPLCFPLEPRAPAARSGPCHLGFQTTGAKVPIWSTCPEYCQSPQMPACCQKRRGVQQGCCTSTRWRRAAREHV